VRVTGQLSLESRIELHIAQSGGVTLRGIARVFRIDNGGHAATEARMREIEPILTRLEKAGRIPDYLCTFGKPGENPEPVAHTPEEFPVALWQRYASPVWVTTGAETDPGFLDCHPDINPSETLQHRSAREHNDERHICPLQLEVIRRGVRLWSNPGDVVLSPFAGIGSEGYVALREGRRFIGAELKRSYYGQATRNLRVAVEPEAVGLFGSQDPIESADDDEPAETEAQRLDREEYEARKARKGRSTTIGGEYVPKEEG